MLDLILNKSTPRTPYKPRGFTIVELLIVIVVLAILAAITTVAYNGLNQRAKNSAVQADIAQTQKELKLAAVESDTCNFLATYTNSRANYTNNTLTSAPVDLRRCEQNIMLNTALSPGGPITNDNFAAYWKGVVTIPTTGSYTFHAGADDNLRVYINNELVLNSGWTMGVTHTATYTAGEKLLIRFEFGEDGGQARATLQWEGPGITLSPVEPSS